MYSPGLKFPITCLSLRMCTYSGSSLKGHSRKETDLLTAAFTKPHFHSQTDFYIPVNDQFTILRAGSLEHEILGKFWRRSRQNFPRNHTSEPARRLTTPVGGQDTFRVYEFDFSFEFVSKLP